MTTIAEDLKMKLEVIQSLPGSNKEAQVWDATARNVLHDDLGKFSDSFCAEYDLDTTTRDYERIYSQAGLQKWH